MATLSRQCCRVPSSAAVLRTVQIQQYKQFHNSTDVQKEKQIVAWINDDGRNQWTNQTLDQEETVNSVNYLQYTLFHMYCTVLQNRGKWEPMGIDIFYNVYSCSLLTIYTLFHTYTLYSIVQQSRGKWEPMGIDICYNVYSCSLLTIYTLFHMYKSIVEPWKMGTHGTFATLYKYVKQNDIKSLHFCVPTWPQLRKLF